MIDGRVKVTGKPSKYFSLTIYPPNHRRLRLVPLHGGGTPLSVLCRTTSELRFPVLPPPRMAQMPPRPSLGPLFNPAQTFVRTVPDTTFRITKKYRFLRDSGKLLPPPRSASWLMRKCHPSTYNAPLSQSMRHVSR